MTKREKQEMENNVQGIIKFAKRLNPNVTEEQIVGNIKAIVPLMSL